VFDKTDTLTHGKPVVVNAGLLLASTTDDAGWTVDRLMQLAASAEADSEHPIATAIVAGAKATGLPPTFGRADDFVATPGRGLACTVDGRRVLIGNRAWMADHGLLTPATTTEGTLLEANVQPEERLGRTVMLVAVDGVLVGWIAVADTLKPEAAAVVAALRQRGTEVYMLSGDNERTARAIAALAGIDKVCRKAMQAKQ